MKDYRAEFYLDADEPVFAGHFPGDPVFPGVLTLALVRETVQRAEGHGWRLGALSRHKLMRPLVPGDRVSVHCRVAERHGEALMLECDLALTDGSRVASARLRLDREVDADRASGSRPLIGTL